MNWSHSRAYYHRRSSIYHVCTSVVVEKMTFDRNSWKRSRPIQSIYDFFVRKYTQCQKRLQIDAKSAQITDNWKWLGKRDQRSRHAADIICLRTMKSHTSYDYNFSPRESSESERWLLVLNIDLYDLSSSLIRDYTLWSSDKFRDSNDDFCKRLRQTHFRPIFDVETFVSKRHAHIKICSSRQFEFTWHFCGRLNIKRYWHSGEMTHQSRRKHIVTKLHCTIGMMTVPSGMKCSPPFLEKMMSVDPVIFHGRRQRVPNLHVSKITGKDVEQYRDS